MSAGTLEFACPACRRPLRLPQSWAGRSGACPRCREQVQVPTTSQPLGDATGPKLEPAGSKAGAASRGAPGDPGLPGLARRPCPSCGEAIVSTAAKCRFCGEELRPIQRLPGQRRPPQPLASRGERLAAYTIDRAVWVPGLCLGVAAIALSDMPRSSRPPAGLLWGLGLASLAWGVGLLALQASLTVRRGGTLGKLWCRLGVVDVEGRTPGFVVGVVRRSWLLGFLYLGSAILYVVPCVLWLIDKAMVLAQDQRSLRDHLAGTWVVRAQPGAASAEGA